MPVIKSKKNGKNKTEYDIASIVKLLEGLPKDRTYVGIERIAPMPGNGNVSMFNFGEGFGILKGIVGALRLNLLLISPMTWKKEYGDQLLKKLEKPEILKLSPVEVNRLSATDRKKHKEAKVLHKQEMDKAKKLAKDHARELAGKLYPNLSEEFELKKDDGKAEALLIAEYLRRQLNAAQ
jgi:hypothetical protein